MSSRNAKGRVQRELHSLDAEHARWLIAPRQIVLTQAAAEIIQAKTAKSARRVDLQVVRDLNSLAFERAELAICVATELSGKKELPDGPFWIVLEAEQGALRLHEEFALFGIGPTEHGGLLPAITLGEPLLLDSTAADSSFALVAGAGGLIKELVTAFERRGLAPGIALSTGGDTSRGLSVEELISGLSAVVAPPKTVAAIAPLTEQCVKALADAAKRTHIVLLATAQSDVERQRRALLEADGVIVLSDFNVWFETALLLAAHGEVSPAKIRIDAKAGSLLELAANSAGYGAYLGGAGAVDLTLRGVNVHSRERAQDGRVIPLATHSGELAPNSQAKVRSANADIALCGVSSAMAAVSAVKAHAERRARGLGTPPLDLSDRPQSDRTTMTRTLDRALKWRPKTLSDHDTKIVLKSFGIAVSRQALATSASAAARLAPRVGFPVEIRPHGHDLPTPAGGLHVVRNIRTIAEARRAYLTCAKQSPFEAIAIRQAAISGIELNVRLFQNGLPDRWLIEIGVHRENSSGAIAANREGAPLPILFSPAPLRKADAERLARDEKLLRRGATKYDIPGLVDILYRLSWAIVDLSADITEICVEKLIVPEQGESAIVAEAYAKVKTK